MNICLFEPEEINKPLNIRDERANHILKILHKKEGDSFAAGIIGSKAGHAVIKSINVQEQKSLDGKKTFDTGSILFDFVAETDGKPLHPLCMIIGFPRPIQLKRLLRDMAGLGVLEVHLTATELSEKSYLKSELATSEAGYKMLLEGTQQAASTHIPSLFRHETLEQCLECIEKKYTTSFNKLALDNVKATGSLYNFLQNKNIEQTVAAIGSERGWTDKERDLLVNKGYSLLSMGTRVLRTETAATVSASLILGSMGVLN